ncbi:hypothetical protein DRO48_00720 [Candidatus Bathyarchaeota archaeon]|nr:MAG: hypothetical protein DRO48_00720 [Candidatus Bathyarchaeota archaeon]
MVVAVERLDELDRKLLLDLLMDGRAPYAELGKKYGLSRQAIYNRIQSLKKRGVIKGFTVEVNPRSLGLNLRAYILIVAEPSREVREESEKLLRKYPQISAIHLLLGRFDVLLDVLVRDIDELKNLLMEIHSLKMVRKTETFIVYQSVKDYPKHPIEGALARG